MQYFLEGENWRIRECLQTQPFILSLSKDGWLRAAESQIILRQAQDEDARVNTMKTQGQTLCKQPLEQVLALGGHDCGHHAVGMQLLAGVADVLADSVNTYVQLVGNLRRAKPQR